MTTFPAAMFPFEAPMRVEADITGLEVIKGEVPEHLDGTYYRVVTDRAWPSKVPGDLFFNEDGMATYFRFSKGRVDFRSRYVRTPRFEVEREAGEALFGAYRNPYTDDPSVAGISRGLANTNVFYHGGKLYASKEDAPPILLDPITLDTIGEYDFEGALTARTCTAHPKTDPVTGEMVFFAYEAKGEVTPDIAYYEADPSGKIVHETWFRAPYTSMVHDFCVTQNFVIFPIIPIRAEDEWLRRGEPHFKWDPDEDVYLGVLPRKGTAEQLRWFQGPNRFASHILGASDDGRHIHIETPVGESNFFPFFPTTTGAPYDPIRARGYLSRWTIDMGAPGEGFTEERLVDTPGEFPRMDDRFETLPHHWGVLALNHVPGEERPGGGFRWISRVDLTGRRQQIWYAGDDCSVGEPLFVPGADDAPEGQGYVMVVVGRHQQMRSDLTGRRAPQIWHAGDDSSVGEPLFVPGADDAPEGQGYVLVVVGRHQEMRSDLVILDAQRIDGPPVATVALPMRIRRGLHGNWVSGSELRTRTA